MFNEVLDIRRQHSLLFCNLCDTHHTLPEVAAEELKVDARTEVSSKKSSNKSTKGRNKATKKAMSYRDKASEAKLEKKEKAAAAKREEALETGAVSEDPLTGRDLIYMLGRSIDANGCGQRRYDNPTLWR